MYSSIMPIESENLSEMNQTLLDIKTRCQTSLLLINKALSLRQDPKVSNADTMKIYRYLKCSYWKATFLTYLRIAMWIRNNFEKQNRVVYYYSRPLSRIIFSNYRLSSKLDQENPKQYYKPFNQVLDLFEDQFQNFKVVGRWLNTVFKPLDDFFLRTKNTNLANTAYQLFKVVYFDPFMEVFLKTIFHFFDHARNYKIQPPKKISKIIKIFAEINSKKVNLQKDQLNQEFDFTPEGVQHQAKKYYQETFEEPYIEEVTYCDLSFQLSKFYKNKCNSWLHLNTPEFIQHVTQTFQIETSLIDQFYAVSRRRILAKLEQILIIEVGRVRSMLANEQHEQLKQCYLIMKRVPDQLPMISKQLIYYLEGIGSNINTAENEPQTNPQARPFPEQYIELILAWMDQAKYLVEEVFENDMEMQKAYNTVFSSILNTNEKSPQYLAIHCDIFLKVDKMSDYAEFLQRQQQIKEVFQYIYQRDIFFKHYQKLMSNRLLGGQYKNRDSEKQMILQFQGQAETTAITKLTTMLNDINFSEEFHESIKGNIQQQLRFEFSASLLSQGCWPLQNNVDNLNLPNNMADILNAYKQIYLQKFNDRELSWCFNLGTGKLIFKTTKNQRYFFLVTTMQMIVFLQFNADQTVTVGELQRRTTMSKQDLENCLIPFVYYKILKREKPYLETFDDDETISIQLEFQNKSKTMKLLPNPKMAPKRVQEQRQVSAEEQQQIEQVMEEREIVVDTQLVRLMKSRQLMKHHELVQDCIKMITIFKPDVNFIKKRIESLIEREYLRRDELDLNTYSYVN